MSVIRKGKLINIALTLSFILLSQYVLGKNYFPPKKDSIPDISLLMDSSRSFLMNSQFEKGALVLLKGNTALLSPELFLYASLMYSKAGKSDQAAHAMIMAIEAGMLNSNILSKDPALDTIKNSSQWPEIESSLKSIQHKLADPANFKVDINPVKEFFTLLETSNEEFYTKEIFSKYVLQGSEGIRDFYVVSYKNVDDAVKILQDSIQIYKTLKDIYKAGTLDSVGRTVKGYLNNFSNHFDEGTYPTVYLMPGIFKSAGTATNAGLFIGVEKFIQRSLENEANNPDSSSPVLKDMAHTIFHELMHFQQAYHQDNPQSVLYKVLEEGSATFLTTLFTGGDINSTPFEFLQDSANLKITMQRFNKDMFTNKYSDWVYNSGSPDWPRDIGYHLGAEICRSYYLKKDNKRLAVHRLLRTDDLTEIIRGSKYAWLLD